MWKFTSCIRPLRSLHTTSINRNDIKTTIKSLSCPIRPNLASSGTSVSHSLSNGVRLLSTRTPTQEQCNEQRDWQGAGYSSIHDTYYTRWYPSQTVQEFTEQWSSLAPGARVEEKRVRLAGRVRTKRESSKKLVFYDLEDSTGSVQIMASRDRYEAIRIQDTHQRLSPEISDEKLTERRRQTFRSINSMIRRGDIIGIEGFPAKSGKGELSIMPYRMELLAPCQRNLPVRNHLEDHDIKFRQRYLDMITNDGVRERFRKRATIMTSIRRWLEKEGFIEVETPILYDFAGGALANSFETQMNATHKQVHLRVAPELFLKQLVIGGFDRVFELGKVFRNEGLSPFHHPEFTSCEFYMAYADLNILIKMTQTMLGAIVENVNESKYVNVNLLNYMGAELYQRKLELDKKFGPLPGQSNHDSSTSQNESDILIDFHSDYLQVSVPDVLQERLGEELPDSESTDATEKMEMILRRHNISCPEPRTYARMFDKLIGHLIEPQCIQPTFLMDHPIALSPLAKRISKDHDRAARFELFVAGKELVNAYEELNDPDEQLQRFHDQNEIRKLKGDDEAHVKDESFVEALRYGLPPTGGWGLGVDRLTMLLTQATHIREVLLFPVMRSVTTS